MLKQTRKTSTRTYVFQKNCHNAANKLNPNTIVKIYNSVDFIYVYTNNLLDIF